MDQTMDITLKTKAEIIVISADVIQNAAEDGNKFGIIVYYSFNTTFERVKKDRNSFGQVPGKIWLDYNRLCKIIAAPAKYIATFGIKISQNGSPYLILKDIDYICDVKIISNIICEPPTTYIDMN